MVYLRMIFVCLFAFELNLIERVTNCVCTNETINSCNPRK
jgi:hypothetical protein